jgi:hypothetical protein
MDISAYAGARDISPRDMLGARIIKHNMLCVGDHHFVD